MKKSFVLFMMALIVLAVSGGCCGRTCVEPTAAPVTSEKWLDPSKIKQLRTHRGELLQEAIQIPVTAAEPDPLEILILSGGGQNGAFGAGFLSGLTQRADASDFLFDIVTGISTGALQATFAFLGPDYYTMLEGFYSNLSQCDIFVNRLFPFVLWSDSIADSAPLRTLLENTITLDIIEKVAQAHTAGRRLFVGTVDLDNGDMIVWDMGAIAQGRNQQALEKYHDILMAASAVPVLLPPVEIEYTTSTGELYEGLHVDGGLREIVFFRHFMADLGDSLPEPGSSPDKNRLTIIVNGKIGLGYNCIDTHWIPIAKRTLGASLDETASNGVLRAYLIACAENMDFQLMRIPDDIEIDPIETTFNTATMQMLIEKGRELAQLDPIPYETSPPFAEDFVEICSRLRNP